MNHLPAGPATLAIRPHRLRVVDAGAGRLPGRIVRAAYIGHRAEYMISTPWGELLAFDPEVGEMWRREAVVGVDFDAAAAIVLQR